MSMIATYSSRCPETFHCSSAEWLVVKRAPSASCHGIN